MAATAKTDFCRDCPVGGQFNKADQTCSRPDPADGLPAACVGDWVDDKHARLRKYIDISRAVRRKFLKPGSGATYIDLYCGPGRARIRQTNRIVDGSALVAAREAQATSTSFTDICIGDMNASFVAATTQRLKAAGASVTPFTGAAEETVADVARRLPVDGLHFSFLDPYDLATLPFAVIRTLSALQRMDILVHVSVQDLQRNLGRYMKNQESPLDGFAPGWRKVVTGQTTVGEYRRRVREFWLGLIREQGLSTAEGVELVTGSKNQNLYWLIFAARHQLALKFWDQIRNISPQREIDF